MYQIWANVLVPKLISVENAWIAGILPCGKRLFKIQASVGSAGSFTEDPALQELNIATYVPETELSSDDIQILEDIIDDYEGYVGQSDWDQIYVLVSETTVITAKAYEIAPVADGRWVLTANGGGEISEYRLACPFIQVYEADQEILDQYLSKVSPTKETLDGALHSTLEESDEFEFEENREQMIEAILEHKDNTRSKAELNSMSDGALEDLVAKLATSEDAEEDAEEEEEEDADNDEADTDEEPASRSEVSEVFGMGGLTKMLRLNYSRLQKALQKQSFDHSPSHLDTFSEFLTKIQNEEVLLVPVDQDVLRGFLLDSLNVSERSIAQRGFGGLCSGLYEHMDNFVESLEGEGEPDADSEDDSDELEVVAKSIPEPDEATPAIVTKTVLSSRDTENLRLALVATGEVGRRQVLAMSDSALISRAIDILDEDDGDEEHEHDTEHG